MNEMIARVIEGWSTYTVRQLGSKFYICKNTGTNAPPLIPDLDMTEAIEKCREMNARAAIEAMREPTEAMVAAGVAAIPGSGSGDVNVFMFPGAVNGIFQAMIDAALEKE